MASSSSQSAYEVFLSFRGEDTREGFSSHLAAALDQKQIQFFIDDEELKKGDEISPALANAIETSDISIIIFSKDYASSKWCLSELVKILDCKKINGQIVIPVFYHVDPSDVRKQSRSFGEAFVEYEKNFPHKVQRWRDALIEASNLSGYDATESRTEAELVKEIAADISKKLEDMSDATHLDGFVGLNSRIDEVRSLLCLESRDVRIVGIWGMGGIGKTTIASAVFHQISRHFQGKCFMANVREESNKMGIIHARDERKHEGKEAESQISTLKNLCCFSNKVLKISFMAASSSCLTAQCKYDVFVSFRGEDTRDNFTSHLVAALCQKKIKTFIDEQLDRGEEISPALLDAIERSKISVIIFSENYASSKW